MLGTFADHAPRLQAAGWAVLPGKGKSPQVNGFNTWGGPPRAETIANWAKRKPDADILCVAGICKTLKGRGIIVVDPDDETAIGQAAEFFGPTPCRIRTRRGINGVYTGDGAAIERILGGKRTSLRPYGYNIDIKYGIGGTSIAVLPPSVHEKDPSIRYGWHECDETALSHAAPFPEAKFAALVAKHSTPDHKPLRDGSRKQASNDELIPHLFSCANFEQFLDIARTWNENLPARNYEPLEDAILIRRARVVWQHRERFVPMLGQGGIAQMKRTDFDALFSLDPKTAADAFALLARFNFDHSARCKRGETFAINPTTMKSAQVLPGWSRERYEAARDLLLKAGLIKCVQPFRMIKGERRAAQYSL